MLREPRLVAESAATHEECAHLGLFPGEMVYRVDRIRGQGKQLCVESVWLVAVLFPLLQMPVPRITALADIYGLQLGEVLESVSITPASADIARAFGVAKGTLVLRSDRVVHLRDGRPAEWRVSTARTKKIWRVW